METTTLRAAAALLGAHDARRDVELEIGGGRVTAVRPAASLTPRERRRVIAPGFVNAHAHLDLGALGDAVPPGAGFLDWVGRLLAARAALSRAELERGARASAQAALTSGTTSVVDIDACGVVDTALADSPLRRLGMTELIDGSPRGFDDRSSAAFDAAQRSVRRRTGGTPWEGEHLTHGWSPHGTHTVGDELLERLGRLRGELGSPGVPVTVHWAETPDEARWLRDGSGPFAAWLGPSPGVSGIERLRRASMLDGALLVHGNVPEPGDAARIVAAGAAVVHCPGSHCFFGRDPFPLADFDAAGVPVLLGTDSRASNPALDMRREMRLAVESLGVDPARAFRMATEWPARFLPWPHVTGRISTGDAADLVAFDAHDLDLPAAASGEPALAAALLEWLVRGEPDVVGVWIGGKQALR